MKSKNTKISLIYLLVIVMIASLVLATACDNSNTESVLVLPQTDTVSYGQEITLGVATGETYTVTTSHPDLITYQNGKLKVIGSSAQDVVVTITVTTASGAVGTTTVTYIAEKSVKVMVAQQTISDGQSVLLAVSTSEFFVVTTSHPQLVGYDADTSSLKVLASVDVNTDVTVTVTTASGAVGTATITYLTSFDPTSVITLSLASTYIRNGQSVKVTVNVKDGSTDYTVTTDKPDLVKNYQGSLVVVNPADVNTTVTVTAYLNSDPNVKVSKTIQYLADEETITVVPVEASGVTVNDDGSVSIENDGAVTLDVTTSKGSKSFIYVVDADKQYVTIDNATRTISSTGVNKVQRVVTVVVALQEDMDIFTTLTLKIGGKITSTDTEKVFGDIHFTVDMLEAWGNMSVTSTGKYSDIYVNLVDGSLDSTTTYDFTVKMQNGTRWLGSWNAEGVTNNILSDLYFQGENDVVDYNGIEGKALMSAYINKDNQVSYKMVTNYNSLPAIWQQQHYWNHLADLAAYFADFEVDQDLSSDEVGVFKYTVDVNDTDSLYLMTYIPWALTPISADTLETIYFYVGTNGLVKIVGETELLWYGGTDDQNTDGDATAYSQSKFELTLSDLGSTLVNDPTPYEVSADQQEYITKLQEVIDAMALATNYTFKAIDTTTYQPTIDSSDYEISGASVSYARRNSIKIGGVDINTTINQVGLQGVVATQQGIIILGDTMMYQSVSENTNPYRTDWEGYINYDVYSAFNADFANTSIYPAGTYDHFVRSNGAYVGDRKYAGTVSDILPGWTFSADLFECSYNPIAKTYTYILKSSAVVRDIAMEISMHTNADDAEAISGQVFTIILDENFNLVSATYPYSLVQGTYLGYITTNFYNVGSTQFTTDEINDLFSDYTPRQWMSSWDQYTVKYYSATHSTLDSNDAPADVALKDAYGENYLDILPSPAWLLNIFGDTLSGPFYDWSQKGVDDNGNATYKEWIGFKASSNKYDENAKILNYDEISDKIAAEFTEARGWKYDAANSGELKSASTGLVHDRYITYINESAGIMIVFENNMTKWFDIDIYKIGEWSLNR